MVPLSLWQQPNMATAKTEELLVQAVTCGYSRQSLPVSLPTSTGCLLGAFGQCSTTLTITLPSNCSDGLQPPYPTVFMFAGYQVPTRYYRSLAEALARSGFAVLQVPIILLNNICRAPYMTLCMHRQQHITAMTNPQH